MTTHTWGDEWFHQYGPELDDAMNEIDAHYNEATGKHVMMKEKYGTIRYEFLGAIGVINADDFRHLAGAIEAVVARHPNIMNEIIEDYKDNLEQ